jgi:hypothetical protein
MKNRIMTFRVTFYADRACTQEIAIAETRTFSIGLAYVGATRYLETHHKAAADLVKAKCVAFKAEQIPDI